MLRQYSDSQRCGVGIRSLAVSTPSLSRYHSQRAGLPKADHWRSQIRVIPTLARATLLALVLYTVLALAYEDSWDHVAQFSAGPAHIYLFDLLELATLLWVLREAVVRDSVRMPSRNRTVVFLVLGYCAYQMAVVFPVSVIFHDLEPIHVFRSLGWRLALIMIPFVYLVALRHGPFERLMLWLNVAAIALALYALYRYATHAASIHANDVGIDRLRELWGGSSLLFAFLILTCLFLMRAGVLSYLCTVIGLIGLTLTNHRSGFLALLVVVIPTFFHFRHASARVVVIILVVASATTMLVVASPTVRTSTFYSLKTMLNPNADENTKDRYKRSLLGWDYFLAHPLGDYTWSHQLFLVKLPANESFEPHNFMIQLLDEQGIVGFALFMGMVVATALIGWRNRNVDRVSAVMLAYFAYYLIFCSFNTEFINQWNVLLLAVPVGVILSRNAALEGTSDQHSTDARVLTEHDVEGLPVS